MQEILMGSMICCDVAIKFMFGIKTFYRICLMSVWNKSRKQLKC